MNSIGASAKTPIHVIDPHSDGAWPDSVAPGLRRYLTALNGTGPERLVANAAGVRGEILRIGEAVMPVLVSDGAPGKASILSPLGHHVRYPVEEIGRRVRGPGRLVLGALVAPLAVAFRAGALDRVAFVNHWLLSGAPAPDVPDDIWPAILSYLAARHREHALVIQDIKPSLQADLAHALRAAGAIAVPTRTVNIFDPAAPLEGKRFKKVRHSHSRGRRMLRDAEGDLVPREVALRQADTLARLYRSSNIARHSTLNPAYLPAFFEAALGCAEFRLQAWRARGADDDRIAAFNLQRTDAGTIHWSTFGAEPDHPHQGGYYERITYADLAAAKEQSLVLDWGAGAERFKRLRGAVPHAQIEMVFIAHLPARQRAAWRLLARLRDLRRRQLDRRVG